MTPVWLWVLGPREAAWLGAVLAALVLIRHHANIRRMIAGTEPRIGSKR
jgi:glycerol-3-phosphate acyltransferase PlsY